MTEEKETRKQLRIAHAELLKLNELKNNLTQMILHDMKNPLTSIISTAELLEHEKNIPPEEILENIQIISSEGRRLLNMINSLLDIEKFESGKLKLEISPANLNDIIKNEINLLKIPAQLKNIEIEFHEPKNIPLCTCDSIYCSRVIMNILDNSIKYAKSTVKITCKEDHENSGELIICIEDDGPGIPKEYHTRIFEKFETVEVRKEGRKYSTGLGLAFCKMAVKSMGGRIWVESEEGRGSRFYLTLPVAKE